MKGSYYATGLTAVAAASRSLRRGCNLGLLQNCSMLPVLAPPSYRPSSGCRPPCPCVPCCGSRPAQASLPVRGCSPSLREPKETPAGESVGASGEGGSWIELLRSRNWLTNGVFKQMRSHIVKHDGIATSGTVKRLSGAPTALRLEALSRGREGLAPRRHSCPSGKPCAAGSPVESRRSCPRSTAFLLPPPSTCSARPRRFRSITATPRNFRHAHKPRTAEAQPVRRMRSSIARYHFWDLGNANTSLWAPGCLV